MNYLEETKHVRALMTLHDKDIFPDHVEVPGVIWKHRIVGKVIIFNEQGEVALVGNKVNGFFLLPGGGIESNESVQNGIRRECREETGCEIAIMEELGITEDFRTRDAKHCTSYGYSARLISMGVPNPTASEIDIGTYVKWVPFAKVLELFTNQEKEVKAGGVKFYNTCFNILRDSLFIRRAQDLA